MSLDEVEHQVRAIRHQPVDTRIQQRSSTGNIIDRPYVHLEAGIMGGVNQFSVDHPQPAYLERQLQGAGIDAFSPESGVDQPVP